MFQITLSQSLYHFELMLLMSKHLLLIYSIQQCQFKIQCNEVFFLVCLIKKDLKLLDQASYLKLHLTNLSSQYNSIQMQTIPTSRKSMIPQSRQEHSLLTPLISFSKQPYVWDSVAASTSQRDLWSLNCAYHPKERITNFCKDSDCLLPLCPKCIKIHTEQHSKKGIFGNFDTIKDCFHEAEKQYNDTVGYINSLGKLGNQVQLFQRDRIFMVKEAFQHAKKKAFIELQNIFSQYEQIIDSELTKNQKVFNEELLQYQDSLGYVLEGCRNGIKKLRNPISSLQGLINFYGQSQLRNRIKIYEAKLKQISMNIIKISTTDSELQNMGSLIKRYIHFGEKNQELQNYFQEAHQTKVYKPSYAETRHEQLNFRSNYDPYKKSYLRENYRTSSPNQRGVYTSKINAQPSNNAFNGSGNYQNNVNLSSRVNMNVYSYDGIDKYETPLDNYSLEKSRQMKNKISQLKNQGEQHQISYNY